MVDTALTLVEEPLAYGHEARIFHAQFRPGTSDWLATASDDNTVAIWRHRPSATRGSPSLQPRFQRVASCRGHVDSVLRVGWTPDGHTLATGSSDTTVRLWRLHPPVEDTTRDLGHLGADPLATLRGMPEEVYACEWLSDDDGGGSGETRLLLTASGEELFLWDAEVGKLLQRCPPPSSPQATDVPERWQAGYVFGVATQPNGPLVAGACSDGRLRLWGRTGSSLRPLSTVPWVSAMCADCSFSEGDGRLLAATAKDGSVSVTDVRMGRSMLSVVVPNAALFSCELRRLGGRETVVAAASNGAVLLLDVESATSRWAAPTTGPSRTLLSATVSSDGAALAAVGELTVLEVGDFEGPASALGSTPEDREPVQKWAPVHAWRLGLSGNRGPGPEVPQ